MTSSVVLLVLFQFLTAFSFNEVSVQDIRPVKRVSKGVESDVAVILESLGADQLQLEETLGTFRNDIPARKSVHDFAPNGSGDIGEDLEMFAERFPTRPEDAWVVSSVDAGSFAGDLLFDEQLKRFEASLTEKGREELQYRVETRVQQLATGTIPGFEGLGTPQPEDVAFLSAEESTLTPRQQKLRNGIFENFKRISLIEMHEAFTGLVTP